MTLVVFTSSTVLEKSFIEKIKLIYQRRTEEFTDEGIPVLVDELHQGLDSKVDFLEKDYAVCLDLLRTRQIN